MKHPSTRARIGRIVIAIFPALLLAACDTSSPNAPRTTQAQQVSVNKNSSVDEQLDELRAVIAPFQDLSAATGAGWSQLTGCMEDPALGGMGFHFAKADAFDGVVNRLQPKALLYEPKRNGDMRLVAVEFIVPYTIAPREGTPPQLFGEDFVHNDDFGIWMLHAWVDKHNPKGMFATWNQTVSCKAVAPELRMSHGH